MTNELAVFCDLHGIYMESKFDFKTLMWAFYFEKNREAFTKLVGRERVECDENFQKDMIATLRRKYKIPEEVRKNVRR